MPPPPLRRRREAGQASVELVALLPVLVLLALVAWQAAVAGQTVWLAGTAARAAARARAIGADPEAAARAALPVALRDDVRVRRRGAAGVRVRLGIPVVIPGGQQLGSVVREAWFAPQGAS